jgi:D-sedoheptulose 7-phosphate isomerase
MHPVVVGRKALPAICLTNDIAMVTAVARAKLVTIGFAGGDGGKMAEMHAGGLLDFCLTVPTSSIHRIQETHVTLYHIMWDMVHTFLQHRSLVEE